MGPLVSCKGYNGDCCCHCSYITNHIYLSVLKITTFSAFGEKLFIDNVDFLKLQITFCYWCPNLRLNCFDWNKSPNIPWPYYAFAGQKEVHLRHNHKYNYMVYFFFCDNLIGQHHHVWYTFYIHMCPCPVVMYVMYSNYIIIFYCASWAI